MTYPQNTARPGQRRPLTPVRVDRSTCPARKHGDENAYSNYKCRCSDARADHTRYESKRRYGVLPPGTVNPLGARRRLQALAALGHSTADLAERIGCARCTVTRVRAGRTDRGTPPQLMRLELFQRIDRVYRELTWVRGDNDREVRQARRKKWAPPLAWDDIDDPSERPKLGPKKNHQREVPLKDQDHEIKRLIGAGLTSSAVAAELDCSLRTVERSRQRAARAPETAA